MRVVGVLLVLLVLACDPAGTSTVGGPSDPVAIPSATPDLAAAEPPPPTLAAFTEMTIVACAEAVAAIGEAGLRGDPLAADARPRDVRAAVRHFRVAARSWTQAAEELFDFGLPVDRRGQRVLSALDVLALRSQQVADALQGGDEAAAQAAVAALDTARAEADAVARRAGIGPLDHCGRATPRRGGGRRQVVRADDFTFTVGAVQPGRARLVLRNVGSEPHQLFVVRLRSAGTLDDAVAADRRGAPPGEFLAGEGTAGAVTPPGQSSVLDVSFRRGPYAFVCFVASPDGTPHAYKGMALEVAVER